MHLIGPGIRVGRQQAQVQVVRLQRTQRPHHLLPDVRRRGACCTLWPHLYNKTRLDSRSTGSSEATARTATFPFGDGRPSLELYTFPHTFS